MQAYHELTPRAHAELASRASLLTKGQSHCAEAVRLVEEGQVERSSADPEGWQVTGRSKNEMYPVHGDRCPCRTKRNPMDPKGYDCAHLVAVKLYRWVEETMTREGHPMHASDVVNTVTGEIVPDTHADGQELTNDDTEKATGGSVDTSQTSLPTLPPIHALRPLSAIVEDLRRPLPPECVAHKPATKSGTTMIDYLHWTTVARILDHYAPGWEGRVRRVEKVGDKWAVTYRLTLHAQEGIFSQEDLAMEDEDKDDYGDTMTNAIAAAFKRAAAKFGVGRWLYEKDQTSKALAAHFQKELQSAWGELAIRLDAHGVARDDALRLLLEHTGVSKKREVPLVAVRYLAACYATDVDEEKSS